MHGSATLAQGLLHADLVDELRLAVYPVTLGVGKKLFGPDTRLDFEAVDSTLSGTGVVLTTYRRKRADRSDPITRTQVLPTADARKHTVALLTRQ